MERNTSLLRRSEGKSSLCRSEDLVSNRLLVVEIQQHGARWLLRVIQATHRGEIRMDTTSSGNCGDCSLRFRPQWRTRALRTGVAMVKCMRLRHWRGGDGGRGPIFFALFVIVY